MVRLIATDITSPLGMGTESNLLAVMAGKSMLREHSGVHGIPQKITASLFTESQTREMAADGFSRFESLVLHSVGKALENVPSDSAFDVASPRTIFILSTTKADIENLETAPSSYSDPGVSAKRIASRLGFTNDPLVVCNACISGVTAQIIAGRLIDSGYYDHAVVCGADCQSLFSMAGFLSFKAMSAASCRPFDIERNGLNLGECASTMILSGIGTGCSKNEWVMTGSHLDNDSYHISAPSPDGDGVCRAIRAVLEECGSTDLAALCVHGTATMFNDQMESKAISNAKCSEIPVMAFKGYYGHTLGASGVLETVLGLRALEDGVIPGVRGFEETGVSGKMNISGKNRDCDTSKRDFLKIISGFGGCNGAVMWHRTDGCESFDSPALQRVEPRVIHDVRINENSVSIDGRQIPSSDTGKALLTEIYRQKMGSYPKFFKMDTFSRLVLLASELLLQGEEAVEDTAVVLFNASSSIVADRNHLGCIWNGEEFLPSPSAFIYTLPNIATGEVAIKHGFKAETTLYILDHKDEELMNKVVTSTLSHSRFSRMITGWADCRDDYHFEAEMKLITK